MSRAVTADHILFDESIYAFRNEQHNPFIPGKSWSYLLLSFELPDLWQFPDCTVNPSHNIRLLGPYSAFVCRVDNPEWVGRHNSHLYGIALSSIISFATGRVCKSTRDNHLGTYDATKGKDVDRLAQLHPVLIAGPGSSFTSLSSETRTNFKDAMDSLINVLNCLPYEKYRVLMQAIRLVHLSLLTKRDDFGLAYLLIVSAIEAVAQHAVTRKSVRRTHPSEEAWKDKAETDQGFAELLKEYRRIRGMNEYLSERYVEFINKFAPAELWEEIVEHPMQQFVDQLKETTPDADVNHLVENTWFDVYPSQLPAEKLQEIIFTSYRLRSSFVHEGKQPPHLQPRSSERFFQILREIKGAEYVEKLQPNYELMFAIARHSILGWASAELSQ